MFNLIISLCDKSTYIMMHHKRYWNVNISNKQFEPDKNIPNFGNITNHISNHFQFWDIAKTNGAKNQGIQKYRKKLFASHTSTVYVNTLTNRSILDIVAILYFIWCLRSKRGKREKWKIFCLHQSKREYWSYLTQWQFVKLIEEKFCVESIRISVTNTL